MKNIYKKISIMMLLIATTFLLAACGNGENGTNTTETVKEKDLVFRLGYPATSSDVVQGLPGIAIEQKYFEEEFDKIGVKFEAIPFVKAGPAINAAIASGEIEGALRMGDVPSIVAKASGAETTLVDIQPFDYDTHLVVRKDLKLDSVADLKGKTIAVQTSSFMQRILYQILDANGLSPDDVELVNMSETDAATSIAAGTIDATPVTELKAAKLVLNGSVYTLFETSKNPEMAGMLATIINTSFAKEHPEVIEAYFKALLKAQDYAVEHPEDLRELCVESGIEEAVVDWAYPSVEDFGHTTGTLDETYEYFKKVINFLVDNKIASSKVDLDEWFDDSYYKKALEEYNK